MKQIFSIVGLLLLLNCISSCKKEEKVLPGVTTTVVTAISGTTAVSGGTLTDGGSSPILKIGLCWSTSPKPTILDSYTIDTLVDLTFSSKLTQLTLSTKYYVRAYAANSNGISYGNQNSFTTSQIPALTTKEITNLSSTKVTTGGRFAIDNGAHLTAKGVCWGTHENPTIDDSKTIDGDGTKSFDSSVSGLVKGTTYYVRAYAICDDGTTYGNQLTFQTPDEIFLTKENCILSGGSIITTFDGGHIVYGKINNPLYDWMPYIIKLDAKDNRIWETEVSVNISASLPLEQYNSILETKDHKIVFCYKSYVVMIDINGTILWKLEYKTDERYCCFSVLESDEDNLIVLASNELQTSLLKVSLDGRLLWDKVVKDGDDVNYNYGYLLCKLINGNYILAGHSNVNRHWRIWLAEINPTGDIIREKIYLDAYGESYCRDMITTKDGGIIIAGISVGEGNATFARIIKLDSNYDITWEKSYSWDGFANSTSTITQDTNGDYVFCGSQGYQRVKAVLVKLNMNGDELWKRTYWPENEMDYSWAFFNLLQKNDGGYILIGRQGTLWGEMANSIWIKNVDINGH